MYTYWLATSPEVNGVTGKYFDEKRREVKSVKYTYDKKNQQDIMDLTMKYIS